MKEIFILLIQFLFIYSLILFVYQVYKYGIVGYLNHSIERKQMTRHKIGNLIQNNY